MANDVLKYCATDKEVYDLLMSSRQRINVDILHAMGKQRGIFYSPHETREDLASQLSLLPYDYEALDELLLQSANPNRAERVTSVTLNTKVTKEEVTELVSQLQSAVGLEEKVSSYSENTQTQLVQYQYTEIDFGKTRLLQRRDRESDIRIISEGENTIIRMPANEKTKDFVGRLTQVLEQKRLNSIPSGFIEISDLSSDDRTLFFTELISKMEGYSLRNVTKVDVHSGLTPDDEAEDGDDSIDDEETTQAAQEMLSIVENVALHGHMLMSSTEYQQLRQKGFYITAITWISQQEHHPFNKVEFDAGFEQAKEGKAFRYNVRGIYRKRKNKFTKTRIAIEDDEKQALFPIIERTARRLHTELRQKAEIGEESLGAQEES